MKYSYDNSIEYIDMKTKCKNQCLSWIIDNIWFSFYDFVNVKAPCLWVLTKNDIKEL